MKVHCVLHFVLSMLLAICLFFYALLRQVIKLIQYFKNAKHSLAANVNIISVMLEGRKFSCTTAENGIVSVLNASPACVPYH